MCTRVEILLLGLALGLSACEHTQPFAYTPPPPRGPFSDSIPRQLTFNPGDDRFPSVQGSVVAYSRRLSDRPDRDWCVAVLPDTGGVITHELCPPGPVDTIVDAWRFPAVSPDQQSIVYWKERGLITNVVPATRSLVRVNFATPGDTGTVVLDAPYRLPDSTLLNSLREVTWPSPDTVRFIAGLEIVNLFPTDTIFSPVAVAELDLATGKVSLIPGTAGVSTYANAPDGGIWFASGSAVVHVPPGGSATDTVAVFPYPIASLANAGGVPAAVVLFNSAQGPVPVFGAEVSGANGPVFRQLWTGTPPAEIAATGDSPTVVLIVPRGLARGSGANLWMVVAQ